MILFLYVHVTNEFNFHKVMLNSYRKKIYVPQ